MVEPGIELGVILVVEGCNFEVVVVAAGPTVGTFDVFC